MESEILPTASFRYKAFVSYSHADERFAAQLHQNLENYRVPRRLQTRLELTSNRLGTVFRDRDELASSTSLTDVIREALRESEFLIVVCSPNAAASYWVNEEVAVFQDQHGRENVLLIVAPDVPTADPQNWFPQIIHETTDEPLAADARSSADGVRRAIRKLIAGLLGVRFDELQRRETSRRRTRWLGTAGVVAALLTGTGLLLVQARQAEREAADHRTQASALVGYLVDDLEQRLEEYEELGELDARLQQALGFFAAVDLEDLDIVTLVKYRTALRGVGSVRLRQGKLEQALQSFERAAFIGQTLVDLEDDNAKYWHEFAQNTYYIGEAYWEMQDLPAAAEKITQALEYAQRAADLAPENFEYQFEVVFALNNVGAVNTRLKRYEAAVSALTAALEGIERLGRGHEEHTIELLNQEVEAVSWLTEIAPTTGQFDEAFQWHQRELSLRERLLEQTGNIHHSARLSDALGFYAKTLSLVGRTDEAAKALERKIEIAKQLIAQDPDNASWRSRLHMGRVMLAVEVFDGDDQLRALLMLQDAETGLFELLEEGRSTRVISFDLEYVQVSRAYVHLDENPGATLKLADGVISSLQNLMEQSAVNPVAMGYYLRAVILRCAAQRALGTPVNSDLVSDALQLVAQHGNPGSSIYDSAAQAMLLLAIGDSDAAPLIEKLASLGMQSVFFWRMVDRLG